MRLTVAGWCCTRPARFSHNKQGGGGGSCRSSNREVASIGDDLMSKISRRWTSLGNPAWRSAGVSAFRVLQWNILADGLAQNGDFIKVPEDALEWEARWPLIQQEIDESGAHLICMQEVNTYDDFLEPSLRSKGYDSFFLPKNQSPATRYGKQKDGSALFYKSDRFSLVDEPLGRPYLHNGKMMSQGVAALRLKDKESGRDVLVATTHLKAKNGEGNEDTRTKQVSQMATWIGDMIAVHDDAKSNGASEPGRSNSSSPPPDPAIIICGDFNDVPESPPCIQLSESPLGMASLWNVPVSGEKEEDLITTFKHRSGGEAKRVIDYIWFSQQSGLVPSRRWMMPSESEIGPNGLPGVHYGSDHLAVCVEFEWGAPK
ncbi:hypothetical protein BSKO_07171 [Bryopsis sp. KO-2023]|nr:hypothetical protein BSKO_07171 [Bryopsis sp. KO-2023]